MTSEETLRRAILNDEFPNSDEFFKSDSMAQMVPDRLKFERKAALGAWMTLTSGRNVNANAPDWQANKDALVRGFFRDSAASNVSDETVHDLIRSHIQTSDNATDIALNSALTGRPLAQTLNEIQALAGVSKTRGIRDRYVSAASSLYSDIAAKRNLYSDVINKVSGSLGKMLKKTDTDIGMTDVFNDAAERLMGVPAEDRRLVIEAIAATGNATAEERSSYLSKFEWRVNRMAETLGAASVSNLSNALESVLDLAAFGSGLADPRDVAGAAPEGNKSRELSLLAQQIRTAANEKLDPIKSNSWIGKQGLALADMATQSGVALVNPLAGFAVNLAYFNDTMGADAMTQNPGLTVEQADKITAIGAPVNAAIETITALIPFGKVKLPFVQKWLMAETASVGGALRNFGIRATTGTATEIGEEIAQAYVPLKIQELMGAMGQDMPAVDWERNMPKFADIAAEVWAPALVFSIVGAGAASINDINNGRSLASDLDLLIARGIAPDTAAKIKEASDLGDYNTVDSLFREEFVSETKASKPDIQAATERLKARFKDQSSIDVLQDATSPEYTAKVIRTATGWQVQTGDGNVVTTETKEAADQIYSKIRQVGNQKEAEVITEILEYFYSSGMGRGAQVEMTGETTMAQEIKAGEGRVFAERRDASGGLISQRQFGPQALETVRAEAEAAGIQTDTRGIFARINGSNEVFPQQVGDTAKGIWRILNLFESRKNATPQVATLLHEDIESKFTLGLINKSWTVGDIQKAFAGLLPAFANITAPIVQTDEQIAKMSKSAQEAYYAKQSEFNWINNVRNIVDGKFDAATLRETFSEMYVRDRFALDRKGLPTGLPAGLISRGIEASIMGATTQEEAGIYKRFRAMFKAFSAHFKAVFKTVQTMVAARKEGKIGEDWDSFVNKVLGIDEVKRDEGKVVDEVKTMLGIDEEVQAVIDVGNMAFSISPPTQEEIDGILPGATYIEPSDLMFADISGPVIVGAYHGTTHDIQKFTDERANLENDMGAGIYASNEIEDINANYAGEGPDLSQRIELAKEQLVNEGLDEADAEVEARARLKGSDGAILPLLIPMKNPVVLEKGSGTLITLSMDAEEYREEAEARVMENNGIEREELEDYSGEIADEMQNVAAENGEIGPLQKILDVVSEFDETDANAVAEALQEYTYQGEGIYAADLEAELRKNKGTVYATYGDEGKLAVGELIRRVFMDALGFDGIIDRNVNSKFGSQGRGKAMAGMDENTAHIIVATDTELRPRSAFNSNISFSISPIVGVRNAASAVNFKENPSIINPQKTKGRVKVIDLARALDQRAVDLGYKREANDYSQETIDHISDAMAEEIAYMLQRDGSGVGWYDVKINSALDLMSRVYPELNTDPEAKLRFLVMVASISQGNAVDLNFEFADRAYGEYRTTKQLPTFPYPGKSNEDITRNIAFLFETIDKRGAEDTLKLLKDIKTVREWNKLGYEVTGEVVDAKVTGAMAIMGSKIGSFFGNLNGDFTSLTADLWFSRSWNRYTGNMESLVGDGIFDDIRQILQPLRGKSILHGFSKADIMSDDDVAAKWVAIVAKDYAQGGFKDKTPLNVKANTAAKKLAGETNDAPRGGVERQAMRATVASAIQKVVALGFPELTMADAQAILWFNEKDLFQIYKAVNKTGAKTDYETAAQDVVKSHGLNYTVSDQFRRNDGGAIQPRVGTSAEEFKTSFRDDSRTIQENASNQLTFSISPVRNLNELSDQVERQFAENPVGALEVKSRMIRQFTKLADKWSNERWTPQGNKIRPISEKRTVKSLDKEQAMRQARALDEILANQGFTSADAMKSKDAKDYEAWQRFQESKDLLLSGGMTEEEAQKLAGASASTWRKNFVNAIREATKKAKAEAQAWRDETDAMQKEDWSPRESLVRDLITLEAIRAMFPQEIRDKIGGFVALARKASESARLKVLQKQLERGQVLLEKHLKDQYNVSLLKMLDKAAPVGKPGEIKKSKFIVTVQDELDAISEIVGMDSDDVTESITTNEAAIISAQTPEAADAALTRLNLLELFGGILDLKRTSSQEMEVAHEYLAKLMQQGREARKIIDEARSAKVKEMVATAKADAFKGQTGPETTQAARAKAAKESGMAMLKKFFSELSGFDAVLRDAFGPQSETARSFSERFTLNSNDFEDVQNERRTRFRDFARELYQTKFGAKINQKLIKLERIENNSGVTYLKNREVKSHKFTEADAAKIVADPKAFGFTDKDAAAISEEIQAIQNSGGRRKVFTYDQIISNGERVEIPLSQMDAVYISMALRQPGILEQQERHGYDQQTVDELDKYLTDEAKAWRRWMQTEYDAEYQRANEVYMRMFNARMPMIMFYAPLLKNHQGQQAILDPLNTGISSNSANPGSIKTRKGRTSSLRIESALTVFWAHFNQMEYWIANAEYLRDVQAVLLNPEVRESVVASHGEDGMATISAWIQLQMSRGVGKAAMATAGNKMFRNVKTGLTMKALALSYTTALKTLPSVFYSLGEIHMSKWPAALVSGMTHWNRLWKTNIIQRRLDIGGMPELRDLGSSAMPMSWMNQLIKYGSAPAMYADGVFTTFSAAMAYGVNYDEAIRQGASEDLAHKHAEERTALIVSRTAQPENWTQKSLLENDVGAFGSMFTLFMSDPRQKMALTGAALNQFRKGNATGEEAARKFLAYWIIPGIMFQLANAIGRSLFKGDDDEWEVVDFATAALVGQFQGLVLLGSGVEMIFSAAIAAAAEKITAEEVKRKPFWNSSKNPLDQAAQDLIKSAENLNDTNKDVFEKTWEVIKSVGLLTTWLNPAGAVPATVERVIKDTTNLFYGAEDQ